MVFEQLQGAAGDVKELEYISALHQTDLKQVRQDCSIYAEDVRLFLLSRYGIKVEVEDVRLIIFAGLAGSDDQEECIDLMELVAMLLIPTLLKAAKQECGEQLPEDLAAPPPGMLDHALKMILEDVTQSNSPKPLSRDLLKAILEAYGEVELAQNCELLDEMIEGAVGDSPSTRDLDLTTFARGLTHDIRLYDVNSEALEGTNMSLVYRDAQHDSQVTEKDAHKNVGFHVSSEERLELSIGRPLDRKPTLPEIDLTAETYRSRSLMVLLWTTILLTFFAYYVGDIETDSPCEEDEAFSYVYNAAWHENSNAIQCEALSSIKAWLIRFINMSLMGLACSALGSVGNSAECKKAWEPCFGGCFVILFVLIPYAVIPWNDSGDAVLSIASLVTGLITGSMHLHHSYMLLSEEAHGRIMQRVRRWIAEDGSFEKWLRSTVARVKKWVSSNDNAVFAETKVKRAAARKLVAMTSNALEVVQVKDKEMIIKSNFAQALQAYTKAGRKYVMAGGWQWAWSRMLGRNSFADDGIWLPVRFIASNVAQYVVAIYTFFAGISLTSRVSANYDSDGATDQLIDYLGRALQTVIEDESVQYLSSQISGIVGNYMVYQSQFTDFGCEGFTSDANQVVEKYCRTVDGGPLECTTNTTDFICALVSSETLTLTQQANLLLGSGFNQTFLEETARSSLHGAMEASVRSLYPSEKYMVVVPLTLATIVSFVVAFYLSVTYIPSVIATILKLRCGVIPTLRDKEFFKYRVAPDQVSTLTGSIFWGTFVSSLVVGFFVGLISFFFVWQGTAYFAQRFVALIIGMVMIITIRLLLLLTCRCTMYRSFYRERPAAANLSILALEWANFLVSAGFVLVRMAKLLVVAGASIGRIDTPFLAPGVGRIGSFELDAYPLVHTKDILSHEAHRHPYIEQLGMIYLTKLRYERHFGTRAGSTWRLLFVYALMPWLHRYRLQTLLSRGDDQGLSAHGGGVSSKAEGLVADYNNDAVLKSATLNEADKEVEIDLNTPARMSARATAASDDASADLIRALEAENKRLKAALAEATRKLERD